MLQDINLESIKSMWKVKQLRTNLWDCAGICKESEWQQRKWGAPRDCLEAVEGSCLSLLPKGKLKVILCSCMLIPAHHLNENPSVHRRTIHCKHWLSLFRFNLFLKLWFPNSEGLGITHLLREKHHLKDLVCPLLCRKWCQEKAFMQSKTQQK